MTSSRTIRQTLFVLAFLTWMAVLAGCASSAETSTERTTADTLAAASDSLDVAQPPGDAGGLDQKARAIRMPSQTSTPAGT